MKIKLLLKNFQLFETWYLFFKIMLRWKLLQLVISLFALCSAFVFLKYFSDSTVRRINVSWVSLSDNLLEKAACHHSTHGPEWLRMARMLPVAHAARYACQAARYQARPRWGTINKFEVATSFRQVTTPLHYLRGRAAPNQSQPKMPGPGCDKCKDKCQDCKCGDNCSCCDSGCKDQCSCKSGGKCSCKPCTC